MMLKALTAALTLASSSLAFSQDTGCPPRMPKPLVTTRVPQLDENGFETIITVSEGVDSNRSVSAVYERPMGSFIGPFILDGNIDWTNNTTVRRRMSIRLMVQLDEGIIPIIPEAYSGEVCWEESTNRIITTYQTLVDANSNLNVPIFWEVITRLEGQLADVNGDGWVDAADQGLLMAAFGTDNPLYDLNKDGVVDGGDLGILMSQWSESTDDVIEEANAGGGDSEEPVEVVGDFNPLWETADYIISSNIEIEPIRGGNGQVRIPFPDWQFRA